MLTQNLGNKEWPHHPKTNKVINVENLSEEKSWIQWKVETWD